MTLMQCINECLHLGIDLKFTKCAGPYFIIDAVRDDNGLNEALTFPLSDHCNEEKIVKYIKLLTEKLLG